MGKYRNRWLDALAALDEANGTMDFMADEIEALEAEVSRLRSKLALKDDTSQIEGAENTGETPSEPEKPIAESDNGLKTWRAWDPDIAELAGIRRFGPERRQQMRTLHDATEAQRE